VETIVYVNGKYVPQSEAKVSVFDHGLLYGDGVFEGIRAYNGRVFKLDRHLDRLYASAKAIDLTIPASREEMQEIILETCRRNRIHDGYIRPIVTRGVGDLGIDPRKCKSGGSVIVIAQPGISLYEGAYERGLKVVTSSHRRVPPESLSPSIKSLNYLNNILARIQANQFGADEALFLDLQGYVSEASADNFFIVNGATISTPWTSTNLPGITRETVLELAPRPSRGPSPCTTSGPRTRPSSRGRPRRSGPSSRSMAGRSGTGSRESSRRGSWRRSGTTSRPRGRPSAELGSAPLAFPFGTT